MMSEAEFERRLAISGVDAILSAGDSVSEPTGATGLAGASLDPEPSAAGSASVSLSRAAAASSAGTTRTRAPRGKAVKPRRVQRMFAIEEDLDRKLWLYAIHLGKDRSDVVNDLLRPVVASMVLYDSRDRRASASRSVESSPESEPRELAEAG